MTPEDLARLHALAFTFVPRPWSAAEFAELLVLDSILLETLPEGFALGQIAGPEITLLTLAVHPDHHRRGHGTALLGAFERAAIGREADQVYLEVAETNLPAQALYLGRGYQEVGRRPRYYRPIGAPPIDGLVMRKNLLTPGPREPGKTI